MEEVVTRSWEWPFFGAGESYDRNSEDERFFGAGEQII